MHTRSLTPCLHGRRWQGVAIAKKQGQPIKPELHRNPNTKEDHTSALCEGRFVAGIHPPGHYLAGRSSAVPNRKQASAFPAKHKGMIS
eukprot:1247352-Karenia_brevis.AAC.1